jgi:hypothetical protein
MNYFTNKYTKTTAAVNKAVRKAGVRNLRQGTHPQQWRGGAITGARKRIGGAGGRLGQMKPLGPDTMCEINLSDEGERILKLGFTRDLTLKHVFGLIYNQIYKELREYTDKWIEVKVPSDTENLRKSMHNAMLPSGGSNTDNFPLYVEMNTNGIEYAGVVNKMPTEWLQHPGSHWYNKGRFGQDLEDEGAETGWYNWIVLMGRTKAQTLFQTFLKNTMQRLLRPIAPALGVSGNGIYNEARSMFSARFK